ncbi:MAG TPA: bifunctional (p)ppGpp synthetase/guanosine-3',5'-bis(diphosphate) 3'-pyrophosphohydrolase [Vitreimonas sp.]|uniref:RelA/SpoT family protein n=1 Tax=Vitreimonas sp. TaxID=3069702 RepID=UPI002D693538|nr:bifunctional (p)ppGpp synthetase/guanosine-3',5'-bis(diphosphate) 3'-pyrophosphohydrolase [Vitreimonas sp.]HYD88514.1 bifunctional (p)ppGpp synthetase/guanosine-3',5'-bis(diphosphate) 3'-pyrophosphohydrolase [Vitreimonas sp.]
MAGGDGVAAQVPAGSDQAGAGAAPPRTRFLRQFELVERMRAYDPSLDENLVNRAYVYATAKHGSQKRHSGDPYFAHPIEVAGILTEYRLDAATIVAGLLHDTIEDTEATRDEIEAKFGGEIADLVEGVTKLSQLEIQSEESKQAQNLQKFILAMSRDVRVLIVKLADRLHNMRTLAHVPNSAKRRRIAMETLEIYGPLARRIGMEKMAREIESLAFHEAFPDAEAAINARLEQLRIEKGANVAIIIQTIMEVFEFAGIDARVFGREKQPYSIWRKLQRKSIEFSDLADVYAFRVIVNNPDDCYRALGLIHQTWRCVPDQLEDYISNPKPNGYRSIHTVVIGPGNVRVEIQIRTEEMDQIAENGVAAHWRYKNESYGFDAELAASVGLDAREATRSLLEIAEHGGDANEFLEHAKLEMYQDHVFAFTPKGALIPLPQGATPLDFAYAVHSSIGDRCAGVKINGVERPLRTVLRNGDVVEIIVGEKVGPVPGFEALTKTGRAKSAQRRLQRQAKRDEFAKLGRDLVAHALHRYGHDLAETALLHAAQHLGKEDEEELFIAVGEGSIKASAVAVAAFPGLEEKVRKDQGRKPMEREKAKLYVKGGELTPGVALHFAECCSPIPGDRIIGVQIQGKGVVVHTIDCEQLAPLEDDESVTWVDLAWTPTALHRTLATGRLIATVENKRGVLAELCRIIAENEGDILNLRLAKRTIDFFDMIFDIEVADAKHLTNILAAMRTSKSVKEVERVKG